MNDFIIPKGRPHKFTIQVKKPNSYDNQPLTLLNEVEVKFINTSDMSTVAVINTNSVGAPANTSTYTIGTGPDSLITIYLDPTTTSLFDVARGAKEDGYYLKSTYQATIALTFNDSTPPINVLVDSIYVSPIEV